MATATTITATQTTQPKLHLASPEALRDGVQAEYGDFRDDLIRDGYAVIKDAIPRERAEKYADAMYGWLEGLYVHLPLPVINVSSMADSGVATLASIATIFPLSTETSFRTSPRRVCVCSTL